MKILILALLSMLAACGAMPNLDKMAYDNNVSTNAADAATDEDRMKIVIFDVGQGDSALIVAPSGDACLIDAGVAGSFTSKVLPFLNANRDIDLNCLIITHSDNDHDGAMAEVGIEETATQPGDVIRLSNVRISILAKECKYTDGTEIACEKNDNNAQSSVTLIEYGSFKYLTLGDLPGGGGNPPYQTIDMESKVAALAGDVDILHTAHHGSNTSTNQNLLSITKPEIAIISAGNNNDFWHPHQSTIERLLNAGIEIYQTERGWLKDEFLSAVHVANGDITIETDGSSYFLKTPTYGSERYRPSESRP